MLYQYILFLLAWGFLWWNPTTQKLEWASLNLTQIDEDTESDRENLRLAADAIRILYDKNQPKKADLCTKKLEAFKAKRGLSAPKMRGSVADATCIGGHTAQWKADLSSGALQAFGKKPEGKSFDPKATLACSVV